MKGNVKRPRGPGLSTGQTFQTPLSTPPSAATRAPRSRHETRCSETTKSRQTEPRLREASPCPPSTSPGLLPWPVLDHSQVHRTPEPPQPHLARSQPCSSWVRAAPDHRYSCSTNLWTRATPHSSLPLSPLQQPQPSAPGPATQPPNTPSRQHPGSSAPTHRAAAGAWVSSSGVAVEGLHAHVQRWAGPGADPPPEVSWSRCGTPHRKEESKHH